MTSREDKHDRPYYASRCVVCQVHPRVKRGELCRLCARSYDRFNKQDATTMGLIKWTATRARLFFTRWRKGYF